MKKIPPVKDLRGKKGKQPGTLTTQLIQWGRSGEGAFERVKQGEQKKTVRIAVLSGTKTAKGSEKVSNPGVKSCGVKGTRATRPQARKGAGGETPTAPKEMKCQFWL